MIMTTVLEQVTRRVGRMRVARAEGKVEELGSLERVASYESLLLELEAPKAAPEGR